MSPDAGASNGGKKKPPKKDGSNARERARIAAEQSARKAKRRKLAILVIAIVVVVAAVGVGIGYATNFGKPTATDAKVPTWGPVKVRDGQPITLGDSHAPVTVKLYEDFRCPHCAEFEKDFGETLLDYQRKGTVKLDIYMLTVIDNEDQQQGSLRSGNAFACAAEEGFGQAYYSGLWDNYGKSWSDDQLLDLADQVGKPTDAFKPCVTGLGHQSWMQSAAQAANTDQVQGTPTMFLNGKLQDVSTLTEQKLKDAIDKAA